MRMPTASIHRTAMLAAALALFCASVPAGAADASNFLQRQQQRNTTSATASVVAQAANNLRMFVLGVQKYVYANVGAVPWNITDTTNPISYTPFLIYAAGGTLSAAQAESACSFAYGASTPPGFSSPVNLDSPGNVTPSMSLGGAWTVPTQYLPNNWSAPLNGADCASVWVNQPSAQQITIQTYYAPSTAAQNGSTNANLTSIQLTYSLKTNSSVLSAVPNTTAIWDAGTATTSTQANANASTQALSNTSRTTTGASWQ